VPQFESSLFWSVIPKARAFTNGPRDLAWGFLRCCRCTQDLAPDLDSLADDLATLSFVVKVPLCP